MSSLLAYTTEVSPQKSVAEIIGMLSQAKATTIMQEFDGAGNVTSIAFKVQTQFGLIPFLLPVQVQKVDSTLKELYRRGQIPRRFANDSAHSRRVAWRVLRHWLEAQLALITIGMAKIEEVFLPYAQDDRGRTVFETLQEKKFSGLALPVPSQKEAV